MASKTKKVLFFIVEGPTDEDAFSSVMKKRFEGERVLFHVVHGDITSRSDTNAANAVKQVNCGIIEEMKKYGLNRSDLCGVIHLVDTDGAFIPESAVLDSETGAEEYMLECVITPKRDQVVKRNSKKAAVMKKLSGVTSIISTE